MGTPAFALPALNALQQEHQILAVYTQPDKPVGRGQKVKASPIKERALELGLQVFQPEKLSQTGELERLKELDPDLIVVVAYGQLLKQEVLDLPPLGCINLHSSLLPRWRGAAPIHWALLEGDDQTGVSVQQMVLKLDAGPVLLQEATSVSSDETLESLHNRLAEMGGKLLLKAVDGLAEGSLQPTPQDESQVTYARKIEKDMQWLLPQMQISEAYARLRALNPWPGSSVYVYEQGKPQRRLRILEAKPEMRLANIPPAGTLFDKNGMLYLSFTDGALRLLRLQWEGKKPIDSPGFLNGLKGSGQSLPLQVGSPP